MFLFICLYILLYPLYKYIFDQDAIGYCAIAERVAKGEFFKSINGIWSPLSPWLNVAFIKLGFNCVTGFKILNGIVGCILLYATNIFINKFSIAIRLKALILFTCVPIFLSYAYYELCADFLLLPFFILYITQICSRDFFYSKKRIVLSVLFAFLAYLSKAYFFPFFLLSFFIINIFYYVILKIGDRKKLFIRNLILGILLFLLLCLPWMLALQYKYHYFTYSLHTYINFNNSSGHSPVPLFIEPPYSDSYANWEDPWSPEMLHISLFSSPGIFVKQLKFIVYNFFEASGFFNEISFLSICIILVVFILCLKRNKIFNIDNSVVIVALISALFPLGYLLLHLETRFIWIISITCLTIGSYLITQLFNLYKCTALQKKVLLSIFYISFLIGPIKSLKNGVYQNKESYDMSNIFLKNNIRGRIAANYTDLKNYTTILMANVIAKNRFYSFTRSYDINDFTVALKTFNIDYFIYECENNFDKEILIQSNFYRSAVKIYDSILPGIIVLKLR